jgi:hypothetical protein
MSISEFQDIDRTRGGFMRKISRALITGAVAFSLVGVGAGAAMAESYSALACTLRVDVPNVNNDAFVGREGCSNQIEGEGLIREDRSFFPDDTVGSRSGSDWGVHVVFGSCGNGEGDYYSEFRSSSGAMAQSSRAERC